MNDASTTNALSLFARLKAEIEIAKHTKGHFYEIQKIVRELERAFDDQWMHMVATTCEATATLPPPTPVIPTPAPAPGPSAPPPAPALPDEPALGEEVEQSSSSEEEEEEDDEQIVEEFGFLRDLAF